MSLWKSTDNANLTQELKEKLKNIVEPMNVGQWLREIHRKYEFGVLPPSVRLHFNKIVDCLVDEARGNYQEKARILFLTDSIVEDYHLRELQGEGEVVFCKNSRRIYSFTLNGFTTPIFQRRTRKPQPAQPAPLQAMGHGPLDNGQKGQRGLDHDSLQDRILPVQISQDFLNFSPATPTPRNSKESVTAPSRLVELKSSERIAQEANENQDLSEEEKTENGIARKKRRIEEEKAKEDSKRPTIPRSSKSVYSFLEKLWTVVEQMDCSHPQLDSFLRNVANILNLKRDELEAKKLPDETISFVINCILNSSCQDAKVVMEEIWSTKEYIGLQNVCKSLRRLATRMDLEELKDMEDKVEGILERIGKSHVIMATKFIEVVRFGFSGYLPLGL